MLHTYVHHKEYSKTAWDVAHLYEHLVTRSFQSYLESLGLHPGLVGHISGDTFEHIIFLNATFYDKQVADAYEHFLSTSELIDYHLVPQTLLEIEAEEKMAFLPQSKPMLDSQLRLLISLPWVNNSSVSSEFIDESEASDDVLQGKRTAKEFRDAIVGVYANVDDLDESERILFLRFSALVGDVIDFTIRNKLQGTYYIGSSPISKDNAFMGNMHHIRFKRSIPLELVKETAEGALQAINVPSAMPLITAQFEEFADRATWKSFIIEYYRHTGILTNVEYISSLATPERITSVLSKLKIHVRAMQKSDKEWFS